MLIDFNSFNKSKQGLILFGIIISIVASTYVSLELVYVETHTTPIWLPSGVALAVLLLFGKRVLLPLAIGTFISLLLTAPFEGLPHYQKLTMAFLSSGSVYVQMLAGYSLLKYFKSEADFLTDVRSTFIFAMVALIVGALGATFAIVIRLLLSVFDFQIFTIVWLRWWLGEVVGILIVSSFILSLIKNPKFDISIARLFEVLSLFTLIFVFTQIIFGEWIQDELQNSLPFLVIPVLLWIAFRFSPRETSLAVLTVSMIAVWGTINNTGPFIREDATLSLLVLQLYLGVTAIMAMILSVSVEERKRVKSEYANISESLEKRVSKRTDELATLNKELLIEINQRKIAEAKLKESQERNQALLQSLPDMIFLHNKEGHFIDYRAPNLSMLYLEPQQLIGKPIERVLPVDIANDFIVIFKKVFKTGKTHSYEYSLEINQQQRHFEARVSLCGEDRLMSVIRDISDRKHAEQERGQLEEQVRHAQKLESLGVLAGGIAHDFNNLLTAIMGNTGLAMMNISNKSRTIQNLNNIENASLRAADLCRQLLAYSGKGKFVVEAININVLIKEMSKLLDVSISKKARLSYNFYNPIPAFEADATQIRQIVMNLITNASEAISNNAGNIIIETGILECTVEYLRNSYFDNDLEEGKYIFFDVIDDGTGMTEETKSKLFDPFFTTKFTGRGLGLAAVIGIVRSHMGTIKIESEIGKGTRFRIIFPISKEKYIPEPPTREDCLLWRGNGTVLVVDDDESIRLLGKATLEQVGLKVIMAKDGKEAVDIFRQHADDINLVLMDMTMPHLSGDEAFKKIQAYRSDIKVILSSRYSEQEATQKFSNSALGGFLQKPYRPSDLIFKVKDILTAKK